MNTTESRDEAIARSAVGAGEVWMNDAFEMMHRYASEHHEFMTEDVRKFSLESGLPAPKDNRAWGAVTMRAIKAGLIQKNGFGVTKVSSNARHMLQWKSLICGAPPRINIEDLFS
jgi:hypothetical protein